MPIILYSIYVNVSDQTAILTHEIEMLIWIFWKCFLAFNVLNMTRTDGWIQNFSKKRDVIALKRQYVYSALLWHTVYYCVTSDESDGTQNYPGHPTNEWGWLPRRLGALRGSNSVHDLISDIYWRHSDTVYCSRQGGCKRGNSWSKR